MVISLLRMCGVREGGLVIVGIKGEVREEVALEGTRVAGAAGVDLSEPLLHLHHLKVSHTLSQSGVWISQRFCTTGRMEGMLMLWGEGKGFALLKQVPRRPSGASPVKGMISSLLPTSHHC
jgi:hypothetical protein